MGAAISIELYTFTSGGVVYRYTSHSQNVEHESEVYARATISSSIRNSARVSDSEMEVAIARDVPIVTERILSGVQLPIDVVLVRLDGEESRTAWRGRVSGSTVRGAEVRVSVPSWASTALNEPIPRVKYQRLCNHRLYDDRCQVDPDEFKIETTIASISGDSLDVTSVDSEPDHWLRHGVLHHLASGEKRRIISQVSTTLHLAMPIPGASTSDAVELFAGCDLSIATCFSKFDNRNNFGGTPFIAAEDLARANRGIKPGGALP